ncbi:MAG: nicotinate phosphoribosyltransferase, partial [Candidatus Omnitrophota bacterium]
AILLVDTYGTKKGIENAITIGLYLKEKGHRLQGIRLDSGDIVNLSKMGRRMLDEAGLGFVKIFASGNLDEFKIAGLLRRGAYADSFGVGTNMGTSIDAPSLDVIYKISEASDEEGNFLPTMKLSRNKVTYPGRKQVFRIENKKGPFVKDILGLESEGIMGRPLLAKVMQRGRLLFRHPELNRIRSRLKDNLRRLPEEQKGLYVKDNYKVEISPGLSRLRKGLIRQLVKRQ